MKIIHTVFLYFLLILNFSGYSQIYINEILASNSGNISDPQGEYEDWIELYNAGETPVDIGGMYITDDLEDPTKYWIPDTGPTRTTIPGGEYLLLWADNDPGDGILHLGFKLKEGGEAVGLFRMEGETLQVVDEVIFGDQTADISYGRQPDGSSSFAFFDLPTPGESNIGEGYVVLEPPVFSHEGGFYTEPFTLTLSTAPQLTIYYTLDGSVPDPNNLGGSTYSVELISEQNINRTYKTELYSEGIDISSRTGDSNEIAEIKTTDENWSWDPPTQEIFKATMVRAITSNGRDVSKVATHTFFVDPDMFERYNLPVVSIITEEPNFFDYETGFYVPGANQNSDQSGVEWERPLHIEMFLPNGERVLAQNAGARIHGQRSRDFARKSMRLYARSEYDEQNDFDYEIFPDLRQRNGTDKKVDKFKRLLLRNSGNNWYSNLYHDALAQELVKHLSFETQKSRAVVHFINGEYWGIMNLRQRFDKYYLKDNLNISEEDAVILATSNILESGEPSDIDHFSSIIYFSINNDLSVESNYEHIASLLDIQSYAEYYMIQIYLDNNDWLNNNDLTYRKRVNYDPDAPFGQDGRYRKMLFDLDQTMSNYDHNRLEQILSSTSFHAKIFLNLLENPDFEHLFINLFADHMNTAFLPSRIKEVADSMVAEMAPYIPEHIARWNNLDNDNAPDVLIQFGNNRPEYMRQHLENAFGLSGIYDLNLNVNNSSAGYIHINTLDIKSETPGVEDTPYPWTGTYFNGIPIKLTAIANPGYVFTGWSGDMNSSEEEIGMTPSGNTNLIANFSPIAVNPISGLFINEVLADNDGGISTDEGEFEDWIEIYNDNDEPVDLAGLYITDKLDNPEKFQIPFGDSSLTTVPAKGFLYLWADNEPELGANHLGFKLRADGEEVGLFEKINDSLYVVDELAFGFQIADISYARYPDGSNNLIFSTQTTPGLSNIPGEEIPIVTGLYINEFLAHHWADTTEASGQISDWIEIYNDNEEAVDIGGFFFTDDLEKPYKWQIPIGDTAKTTIPGKGYLVFWADEDIEDEPLYLDINLSRHGDQIGLAQYTSDGFRYVDSLIYGPQLENISYQRYPDGSTNFEFTQIPTPDSSNVSAVPPTPAPIGGIFINELLADNTNDISDEEGELEDWIELYNSNDTLINIGGLYLTDNYDQPTLWRLPDSVMIPANGFIYVWADKSPEQGMMHADFRLSSEGEQIALVQFTPDSIIFIDSLSYGNQQPDISYGRYPDGTFNMEQMVITTPGDSNIYLPLVNLPPQIEPISNQENFQGDHISLFVSANDPEGDTLRFSQIGLPSGLSIDTMTGEISGTITASPDTYTVLIQVTDNGISEESSQVSFDWTINQVLGSNEFWLELECADAIPDNWSQVGNSNYSNGAYLTSSPGERLPPPNNFLSALRYDIEVSETGTYHIYWLGKSGSSHNSIWYYSGNGWNQSNFYGSFTWQKVGQISLTQGSHSLYFAKREGLPIADKMYIGLENSAPNGTGEAANNCEQSVAPINRMARKQRFSIYPNPSYGQFNFLITSDEDGTARLEVLNNLGQLVKKMEVMENTRSILDLTGYAGGIYTVRITNDAYVLTKKIQIVK